MIRTIVMALAALALASCAGGPGPERFVAKEVAVPTPVACTPKLAPDPAYPDSDAALRAAPDLFERVKLLVAGRLMRIARETGLKAALAECAAPIAAKPPAEGSKPDP